MDRGPDIAVHMRKVKDPAYLQDRVLIVNITVDGWKLNPSGIRGDSECEIERGGKEQLEKVHQIVSKSISQGFLIWVLVYLQAH